MLKLTVSIAIGVALSCMTIGLVAATDGVQGGYATPLVIGGLCGLCGSLLADKAAP